MSATSAVYIALSLRDLFQNLKNAICLSTMARPSFVENAIIFYSPTVSKLMVESHVPSTETPRRSSSGRLIHSIIFFLVSNLQGNEYPNVCPTIQIADYAPGYLACLLIGPRALRDRARGTGSVLYRLTDYVHRGPQHTRAWEKIDRSGPR